MHSLHRCFFATVAVVAFGLGAGCGKAADNGSLPPHVTDICPDNPKQCAGSCCGSKCLDTTSDRLNCGGCDIICPNGGQCVNSSCAGCGPSGNACGAGQMCCGTNGCKSLDSDVNNCGTCGNVCASGELCQNSQCVCTTGSCSSSSPDMGSTSSACNDCTATCALGCAGNNCCTENALGLVTPSCTPNPACLQ